MELNEEKKKKLLNRLSRILEYSGYIDGIKERDLDNIYLRFSALYLLQLELNNLTMLLDEISKVKGSNLIQALLDEMILTKEEAEMLEGFLKLRDKIIDGNVEYNEIKEIISKKEYRKINSIASKILHSIFSPSFNPEYKPQK